MKKDCEDCDGKGEWPGLRLMHKCATCEGTGKQPLKHLNQTQQRAISNSEHIYDAYDDYWDDEDYPYED